jgi:hypothetical protein
MQHGQAIARRRRQPVGDLRRAVGRMVVDDHDPQAVDAQQRLGQARQIVALVVGRHDDQRSH